VQRAVAANHGSQTVTLLESEIPAHSHGVSASLADATDQSPAGEKLATGIGIGQYAAPGALSQLSPNTRSPAGGDQPHNNMQPYLALNFCIALQGVYPPRSSGAQPFSIIRRWLMAFRRILWRWRERVRSHFPPPRG